MDSIGNNFQNIGELSNFLLSHGIDTNLYGSGKAKTLDHLLKELQEGESVLKVDKNGKMTRILEVLNINISYGEKILKEEKQVFTDGRVRIRDSLSSSLAEKIKPGEDEINGVKRAIHEELGIILESHQKPQYIEAKEETKESPSFPGIQSVYRFKVFSIVITPEQFKSDGYIEQQADKTTYFVWK